MKKRIILAVETSCDETAAAVIENGKKILANVVWSQSENHARFGGVVPEVSSRLHVESILKVIFESLNVARIGIEEVDGIAVTNGPGLVGSLLVGISAAKTLAWLHNKPLVPVHHLAGHIYSARFASEFSFPLLALVVSGGHTELVCMEEHGKFNVIGETRDDAAGEVFDKVARVLGFPYPGGKYIEKEAEKGHVTEQFPRAWLSGTNDFSFSGLKSAVINHLHNKKQKNEEFNVADIAASFQESVIDVLAQKSLYAAQKYKVKQMLLVGGVAANNALRERMGKTFSILDIPVISAPIELCGDNAAMIGAAGDIILKKGGNDQDYLVLNAVPNLGI